MARALKHTVAGLGVVHWSTKPTRRDKTGCGGLYVSRVVLAPAVTKAIDDACSVEIRRRTKAL